MCQPAEQTPWPPNSKIARSVAVKAVRQLRKKYSKEIGGSVMPTKRFWINVIATLLALLPSGIAALEDSSRAKFEIPISEPFMDLKADQLVTTVHLNLNGTIVATVSNSTCLTNDCPLQFTLFYARQHDQYAFDIDGIKEGVRIYTEILRCSSRITARHIATLHGGSDSYDLDCIDGPVSIIPLHSGIKLESETGIKPQK
jgi:hypothetical protein